jgi:hypothetical protein
MGLLNLFAKSPPVVARLPAGTLSVDRNGRILTTTVSSEFEPELLQLIADQVLRLFREARAAQTPLTELRLRFASLLITAREMRGGVLIFLKPLSTFHVPR